MPGARSTWGWLSWTAKLTATPYEKSWMKQCVFGISLVVASVFASRPATSESDTLTAWFMRATAYNTAGVATKMSRPEAARQASRYDVPLGGGAARIRRRLAAPQVRPHASYCVCGGDHRSVQCRALPRARASGHGAGCGPLGLLDEARTTRRKHVRKRALDLRRRTPEECESLRRRVYVERSPARLWRGRRRRSASPRL